MTHFSPPCYDRRTIGLHWVSVALVMFLWCGAHTIDWFPKGPARVDARSVHIVTGLVLLGVCLFRIHWRLTGGVRIEAAPGWIERLARHVHLLLYGLLLATLGLGLGNAWLRGDSLFGVVRIPPYGDLSLTRRHDLAEQLTAIHSLSANVLLLIAIGHAAMALYHHVVLDDGLLRRMMTPRQDQD
ncbi:MAG: cytochrome b/b6 domain-containing protein [Sphingomonadales bacterium]|nr:cytochrome b/b6 domain-containing protein [Sphingomonadales bacterium]MDE2171573.1 cytochrome b/b6 domain-containing protein [Sphingomonadales bacterium]